MLHKTFDLLDAKSDAETGVFEATVAVFNNVDRGGDRIVPGAFAKTLAGWSASGDPIPVILSHQWDNPMAHIGVVEDAKETDKGLWVKGRLDVNDNDVARQVHRLMERRSLKEFSFGYDVPKGGSKRAKDGATDLTEIDLAEVGPTLKGMNPATELHAVKSALDATTATDHTVEHRLQEVEEQLSKLQKFLEDRETKEAEETAPAVDPLRKQALDAARGVFTDGIDTHPPASQDVDESPTPEPEFDRAEVRKQSREQVVQVLTQGLQAHE
jgi:HK97 family phage prohead protease